MTTITCKVEKCVYNTDGGCKLEKIKVGTKNAMISEATKCESFTECSDCATNSCGCRREPCDCASVSCSAHMCKYNESGKCDADKIEISNCSTVGCSETECCTFKTK